MIEAPTRSVASRLKDGLAVVVILAALYVPQSWFFLMDYPWNSYRLTWLKLFPGLPTFFPVALLPYPNGTLAAIALWTTPAVAAVVLFVLSRKRPRLFWIASAFICAWSTVSAVAAHAVFRA